MPTTTWWFGVERDLHEFIIPDAYAIRKIADQFKKLSDKEFIYEVAHWVRDNFTYPLNSRGEPAAEHEWHYYEYGTDCPYRGLANKILGRLGYIWAESDKRFLFNRRWPYVWQDALMSLVTKIGICIDTAILCSSILRVRKNIRSFCEVGYVTVPGDPRRFGHAWSIAQIEGKWLLIETTIHEKDVENVVEREKAVSDGINGVVYHPIERWNETEYEQLGSWIEVSGLPLGPRGVTEKELREWRHTELEKQKKIWVAFVEETARRRPAGPG